VVFNLIAIGIRFLPRHSKSPKTKNWLSTKSRMANHFYYETPTRKKYLKLQLHNLVRSLYASGYTYSIISHNLKLSKRTIHKIIFKKLATKQLQQDLKKGNLRGSLKISPFRLRVNLKNVLKAFQSWFYAYKNKSIDLIDQIAILNGVEPD
jgi:hypothetical protein